MFVQSVSTMGMSLQNRKALSEAQGQMSALLKEQGTGKKFDVAGEIGPRTAQLIGMHNAFSEAEEYMTSNATITSRLEITQAALTNVVNAVAGDEDSGDASGFIKTLIAGMSGEAGARLVQDAAKDLLANLLGTLNTSNGGRYLFAGTATDTQPAQDSDQVNAGTGVSPNQVLQNVIAAKPPVVDAATLDDLLNGPDGIASVFDNTHTVATHRYATTFYNGSTTDVTGKVDASQEITYGARADGPGVRQVLKAAYTLAAIDMNSMPPAQYHELLAQSLADLQAGVAQITEKKAELGLAEQTVEHAQGRHELLQNVLNGRINDLEAADPYETNVRITTLETQIETSYAMTARLSRLSLVNFL
ncbi:flagellin [Rhodospirillaceae bacterium SYSU D60014]|uniref:flagellin n=1 Tax=Virgifigura deserti TaxID=2268457 RepID=UPI000E661AE7